MPQPLVHLITAKRLVSLTCKKVSELLFSQCSNIFLFLYNNKFSTYDLNDIRLSGALYIRKVAQVIDPNLYRILPVEEPQQIPPISWPKDVQISPVPDWAKQITQLRKQAADKLKEKKEKNI